MSRSQYMLNRYNLMQLLLWSQLIKIAIQYKSLNTFHRVYNYHFFNGMADISLQFDWIKE